MSTNLERASLVSRTVEIESVTLTDLAMSADLGAGFQDELLRLSQRYRARYDGRASGSGRVFVHVDFRFEAHSESADGPEHRVTDIEAGFRVVYRTKAVSEFPPDALRYFAELNGTYNAWPYWRELVQNMTARAGMSNVTVPVFRPTVRPIEVQEDMPIQVGSDASSATRATGTGQP